MGTVPTIILKLAADRATKILRGVGKSFGGDFTTKGLDAASDKAEEWGKKYNWTSQGKRLIADMSSKIHGAEDGIKVFTSDDSRHKAPLMVEKVPIIDGLLYSPQKHQAKLKVNSSPKYTKRDDVLRTRVMPASDPRERNINGRPAGDTEHLYQPYLPRHASFKKKVVELMVGRDPFGLLSKDYAFLPGKAFRRGMLQGAGKEISKAHKTLEPDGWSFSLPEKGRKIIDALSSRLNYAPEGRNKDITDLNAGNFAFDKFTGNYVATDLTPASNNLINRMISEPEQNFYDKGTMLETVKPGRFLADVFKDKRLRESLGKFFTKGPKSFNWINEEYADRAKKVNDKMIEQMM